MKKFWQSKTFWLGVSTVAIAAGDAVLNGGDWRAITMAGIGAAVVVLRKVTKVPIG